MAAGAAVRRRFSAEIEMVGLRALAAGAAEKANAEPLIVANCKTMSISFLCE